MLSQQIKFCPEYIYLHHFLNLFSYSVTCNRYLDKCSTVNLEPRQNTDSFDVVQNSQAG